MLSVLNKAYLESVSLAEAKMNSWFDRVGKAKLLELASRGFSSTEITCDSDADCEACKKWAKANNLTCKVDGLKITLSGWGKS